MCNYMWKLLLLGLVLVHASSNIDLNVELARLETCKQSDLTCLLQLLEWYVKRNDDGKVEKELQEFIKKPHALDYDATFCTLLHLFISSRAIAWTHRAVELNELKHILSLDYVLQDHSCDANLFIRNQRRIYSSDARFQLSSLHEECNNRDLVDYLATNNYQVHPCHKSDALICRDFTIDTPPPTEVMHFPLFQEFIGAASVFDLLHHVYNGAFILSGIARPFRVLFPEYFHVRNLYTLLGFIQRNYESLPSTISVDVVAADASVVSSIQSLVSRCLGKEVQLKVVHSSLDSYLDADPEEYDYIEFNVAGLNHRMQEYLHSFRRILSPIGSVGLTFFTANKHQSKLAKLVAALPVPGDRGRQLVRDYLVMHGLDSLQTDKNLLDFLQSSHNCTDIHTSAVCAYRSDDVNEILQRNGYRVLSRLPSRDVALLQGMQKLQYRARGVTDSDLAAFLIPVFRNTWYISSTNSSTQLQKVVWNESLLEANPDRVTLIPRTDLLRSLVPADMASTATHMDLLLHSYGSNEHFIKRFPAYLIPVFALLPAGGTVEYLLANLLESSRYNASSMPPSLLAMKKDVVSLLRFLEQMNLLTFYLQQVPREIPSQVKANPSYVAEILNTSSASNAVVITNVLSKELLDELVHEVVGMPEAQQVYGAASFYVPLHNHTSRNKVEHLLLTHLAPLVVGSSESRLPEWQGIEWWIQYRDTHDSKEFHLDTALTHCRDLGYEALDRCPFYPAIGTVFYLDDVGGPTVVLDQVMSSCGLHPPLPEAVTVVNPAKNKLLLFRGDLLHGVLNSPTSSGKRLTLLVNYWRGDVHAGSVDTYRSDAVGVSAVARLAGNAVSQHSVVRPAVYVSEYSFADDMEYWQRQLLPPSLAAIPAAQYVVKANASNHVNKHFEWVRKHVVKSCDSSFVVGNWKYWEHSLHTPEKSVTALLVVGDRLPYVHYQIRL